MSLIDDIAIASQAPPLRLLDREALRLLTFSSDRRRLRAGELLFRKGSSSYGAALVLSGSIALDPPEDGSAGGHVVRRGALIGEMALLAPTDHAAQSVAAEASEALIISRELFRRVLTEFPDQAVAIHAYYAARLSELSSEAMSVKRKLDAIA